MKCVDCGRDCRNKCSKCGRPYCAICRDTSGYKACLKYCRTRQVAKKQQNHAAQQRSRQVQASAPAYTPPPALASYANVQPGVQGAPLPATPVSRPAKKPRKMLTLMDVGEFKAWQRRTIEALEDAKARGEAYLQRRSASGTRTSTDIAMERDQVLFDDLLLAMEEIETLWEWAQLQGGQDSEIVTQYDKL